MAQFDEPAPAHEPPRTHLPSVRSTFTADLKSACGIGPDQVVELGPAAEGPARVGGLDAGGSARLRYRYQGDVGEGGMGAVYQVFDDNLRRSLAMKVIRGPTRDARATRSDRQRELSSRFLEEAQITGQLEHPGVVPVYDLGLDDDKQLYFTMRLVRGRTFQQVIELVGRGAESWNLTRALGVLLKVCETMSYAHDKGVVHRDLKPANVMVGRYGEVYVVDWGLARVEGRQDSHDLRPRRDPVSSLHTERQDVRQRSASSPLVTMDGTVVGTPYYMSREQAVGRSEQVGPRSDVYAVGAMLYHLLTGQMPYREAGDSPSPHTVLAMVIQGPPRPVHERAPQVPAELAAICERAMARDLDRRYPDMAALADDLRAFLEGRVVRAHETGAVAELRKWVQRNKPLAASIAAAVLLALGGVSGIGYVQARGRAQLAGINADLEQANAGLTTANANLELSNRQLDQERGTSERVVAFLTDMFRQEDPSFSRGATLTVKEVLDREAARIRGQLGDEPEVRARLMATMGKVYRSLGLHQEARSLLTDALTETTTLFGPDDRRTLSAQSELGLLLIETKDLAAAEPLSEAALRGQLRGLGEDDPATLLSLFRLGTLRYHQGDLATAEELLGQALEGQERVLGAGHLDALKTRLNLAAVHASAGRFELAGDEYAELADVWTAREGRDHPQTLFALANLSFVRTEQGRLGEAEELCVEVLERRMDVLGDDHPDTSTALHNLARIQFLQGRLAEAEEGFREAWQRRAERLGPDAPDSLLSHSSLAITVDARGRADEALALMEAFLPLARRSLPRGNAELVHALGFVHQRYLEQGRQAEADALRRELNLAPPAGR